MGYSWLTIKIVQTKDCQYSESNMKSLSYRNKNKSATRLAQLVPMRIPIICLYNLAVVDPLFIVAPIVCGSSGFVPWFCYALLSVHSSLQLS